ncbi:MAG: phosphopantothenoylcysteine decarboxylase [Thermoguttaceae bacterium]
MKILITSGPTREYLDPVRFISNSSSGKMGASLAAAALENGHEVVIVTGPVSITYPAGVTVFQVETTEQMLGECQRLFPACDCVIGAAAPCDYKPVVVSKTKLSKTHFSGTMQLIETPDILATLGETKRKDQKIVAFALETDSAKENAINKMRRKNADLLVLNGPAAINSDDTSIEIFAADFKSVLKFSGSKSEAARNIIDTVTNQ